MYRNLTNESEEYRQGYKRGWLDGRMVGYDAEKQIKAKTELISEDKEKENENEQE